MTSEDIDEAYYVIVEAYPRPGSEEFRTYHSAAFGCWVRKDLAHSVDELRSFVISDIVEAIPWRAAKFHSIEILSSETESGHELFDQCLVDGWACRVHRVEKEVINPRGVQYRDNLSLFRDFAQGLRQRGGYSFRKEDQGHWANGVSPNGGEFLPLWLSREWASPWLEDWPGYEVRHIEAGDVRDWLLPAVDEEEFVIGCGLAAGVLVTAHPLCLWDMIAGLGG